jgi:predicted RND superfamily exporter protein
MWSKLAHFIIRNRLALIIIIALSTVVMGYYGRNVEPSYDFKNIIPNDDPEWVYFENFKRNFGEDANILAIGLKDSSVYKLQNFNRLKYFSDELATLEGVNQVVSIPNIPTLKKDTANKKFIVEKVFKQTPQSQSELDSLLQEVRRLLFYEGKLINSKNGATLLLITINKEVLNSKNRERLMSDIRMLGDTFTEKTAVKLHYAGLPFVRYTMATKVKAELNEFLILSLVVTIITLFLFFRSLYSVVFPLILIGIVVVFSMGTMGLLGYKITLLSGLIPPVMVVITVPNFIYLINKYHVDYIRHGNKIRALGAIIHKIGIVSLIVNVTTAVGFFTLCFTSVDILKEFGAVATINVMVAFVVSMILVPAVFSYLPPPNPKHLRHLDFRFTNNFINLMGRWALKYQKPVFAFSILITLVSAYGIYKLTPLAYMVDDIPKESELKRDLTFMEENFTGVMPLEIVVDTGKKKGAMNLRNLNKMDELESYLASQKSISAPVSLISFTKAFTQAYYNNNPEFYRLPNNNDKGFILRYLKQQKEQSGLINSFVDKDGQWVRISVKMADIGSIRMDSLVNKNIKPKMEEIFKGSKMKGSVTGSSIVFIKGNDYLIGNLIGSMLLSFVINSFLMALLFSKVRMIIISIIPNVIPMMLTAGIMGFFGIPLKPSTGLIFSIVYGISIDNTIHFLAKYRQELKINRSNVAIAVANSIKETGTSIVYTSIVLFFGFIIFAWSDFGGTVALGILTSTTLLCAMITNLLLLPALLHAFDNGSRKTFFPPLIEHYDEFYHEDEDVAIDLEKIQLREKAIVS